MREIHYELCDVFTHRPLAGNALAVFTDANGIDAATMQALAGDEPLRELVRLAPDECRGGRRDPHLHADDGASVRGSPDAGDRLRPRRQRRADVDPPRDRPRRRGGPSELGVGTARIWMDDQPLPRTPPIARPRRCWRRWASSTSTLPVELYDNGPHYVYVGLDTRDEVRRCGRTSRAWPPWGPPHSASLPEKARAWKCAASSPPRGRGSRRTPRPAPLRDRSRCTWPAMAASRSATRLSSSKGSRSGDHRHCMRAPGRPTAARQRRGRRARRHRGTGNVQAAL